MMKAALSVVHVRICVCGFLCADLFRVDFFARIFGADFSVRTFDADFRADFL